MSDKAREHVLAKVYSAKTTEQIAEAYDGWAATYDRDVLQFGYRIPAIVAGLAGRFIPTERGAILDAGAGTGIIGEALALIGYGELEALDISQGMLDLARKKDVYRQFHCTALGQPLDFPNDTFLSTVAAGVFTTGHAPAESLDELIRITRPGGHLVFTVKTDVLDGSFQTRQDWLEAVGLWRLVFVTPTFHSLPYEDTTVTNRAFVYEVL